MLSIDSTKKLMKLRKKKPGTSEDLKHRSLPLIGRWNFIEEAKPKGFVPGSEGPWKCVICKEI